MAIYDVFLDRIEKNGIVVATNYAGEVPVGTVFTQIAKVRLEGTPGSSNATELWSKPIKLRLLDVIIYRNSVSSIPKGWSAGLVLEGEEYEELSHALIGKSKNEFVHLRSTNSA
jgi:hypothetical protein